MKPLTSEWVSKAEGDFAVFFRYPGESADRAMALRARDFCRSFREAARQSLGI
jgi:hypothetical protein